MLTLTMTKGLPGSGKSYWAKEQVRLSKGQTKRVNKDDLRAMVDAGVWSKENETQILRVRDKLIGHYLSNGFSVIVDDTNLHPKHYEALALMSQNHEVNFQIKDFTDVPLDICIARDQARPNGVGEKVIRQMHRQFLKGVATQYEPPVNNPDLPNCIIVDIDGTLAHGNGRSMYDYTKVDTDLPDEVVVDHVRKVADGPEFDRTYIIIVSGRDNTCRELTEKWLADNQIPYDELFMRDINRVDENKLKVADTIIKQEIYEQYIKPRYNVQYVLDDRNSVVRMWRSLGLKVMQVAEGDF